MVIAIDGDVFTVLHEYCAAPRFDIRRSFRAGYDMFHDMLQGANEVLGVRDCDRRFRRLSVWAVTLGPRVTFAGNQIGKDQRRSDSCCQTFAGIARNEKDPFMVRALADERKVIDRFIQLP